ncbi:InlB B-repeat-containing protein [Gordonibacter sp. 28C]|uniref:InlB B-repeat-containing protein n=1 Tax=Gordonibacter sp. 28C TaxID=2078569 RepID=UPI00131454F1|nr:InlB B-repeat-containing protein [Gordonibacter sp. 28C]
MPHLRTLPTSPPARRALAFLLALLLGLSMLPLAAFAESSARATLDPPAGLGANATSSSSIEISWAATSGAEGYRVLRSTSESGSYEQIANTTSTSYTNTGLSPDTTYYYMVAAYNASETSSFGGPVSARTESLPAQQADPGLNTLVMDNYEPYAHEGFGFTATGDRQDAAGTVNGETRYVPTSWTIRSDLSGFFSGPAPYKDSVIIDQPGNYTLTATYTLQRYIPSVGWLPMDSTATLSVDFTVKARTFELTYLRNYTPDDAFFSPGGSFEEDALVSASDITSVGVPGDNWARVDGYVFGGWLDKDSGNLYYPGEQFRMVKGGMSLTALWGAQADAGKNTLELDNNEPYAHEVFTFTATGDRQDEPGTVDGETRYVPTSWTIRSGLSGDFPSTSPREESAIIDQPGDYTLTATYALEHYSHSMGWQRTGDTATLATDFTVKERTYTLTYLRNHSPEDAFFSPGGEYPAGTSIPLSDVSSVGTTHDDYTRAGYKLIGWNTDRSANWGQVYSYTMPNENTSLYAIWAPAYAVTYDGNGADPGTVPVDNNTYLAGDPVNIPVETPTRAGTGYTFGGWQNPAGGKVYLPGDRFAMPENGITLVALWAEQADKGKNTLVVEDDDLTVGDTLRFTATGDRQEATGDVNGETRYDPVSWTIVPLLSNHMPFANQHPFTDSMVMNMPGNYVLTATFVMRVYDANIKAWHPVGDLEMISVPFTVRAPGAYAVTYDGNGADGGTVPVDALAYAKGDTVTVASDEPTRTGYTFDGWTADHDGKAYRAGDTFSMPEGGTRLVARWTPQAGPAPDNNQAAKPGVPTALSKAGFLPKTGDEAVPFVLLGVVAALGAAGVHALRKKQG